MVRSGRPALFFVAALVTFPSIAHEPGPGTRALDDIAVGAVEFAVGCADAARPLFNRAVALLHSFWFSAAIDTFDDVLKADPDCAMAYWGKAMAHWGNPLGGNRPHELLWPGAAAVERAQAMPAPSAREREYIDAVAALYADYENTSDGVRAVAYEKAMERLVARYPDDAEAAIFFAMALNATADPTDRQHAQLLRAAAILEREFEAQPRHPGIAHYLIHTYDIPVLAKRALPAAMQYADIAPDAPHALHMPSHTFSRLGHWQASIDTNLRSADAALAADSPGEALHALDYMAYAYLQTAQDAAAARVRQRTTEIFADVARDDRYRVAAAFAAAAVPVRFALERGDWAAALDVAPVTSSVPFIDAIVHFAHGLGAARLENVARAREALTQLEAAESVLRATDAYWAGQVAIQRAIVEAWVLFAERNNDAALAHMRAAADAEARTQTSAISPGPLAPALEQLGELLLALDRPEDALSAFERAIVSEPGRFRGLYGGALAAEALGRADVAHAHFARLIALCEQSEFARPELRRAQEYVARN